MSTRKASVSMHIHDLSFLPVWIPQRKLQDSGPNSFPHMIFPKVYTSGCTKPSMIFLPSCWVFTWVLDRPPPFPNPLLHLVAFFTPTPYPFRIIPFACFLRLMDDDDVLGLPTLAVWRWEKGDQPLILSSSICLTIQPPLLLWTLNSCLLSWGWLFMDVDRWNWWDW